MTENQVPSIAELTKKAEAGDAQAQFELAYCLANGKDVEKNIELGLEWLLKSANQGNAEAQFSTGLYYFSGPNSPIQADRLCGMINQYVNQYVMGLEKKYPIVRNFDLHVTLAVAKNFSDCNINLAATWLEKAAAQNHVEANVWLALLYREGLGILQNDKLAFECVLFAAKHGTSSEVQYELARCYLEGKGTIKNFELGIDWCQKAAENGFAKSQYLLACCYLDSAGLEKNFKQGLLWLNKAAQTDASVVVEDRMMMRLADAYEKGQEIEQDDTLCLHWLEKLADSSEDNLLLGEACFRAAVMYFDGKGTSADYKRGVNYLRNAIKSNHAGAKQWLENAYLQFTFPEFIGRSDADHCFQYAYSWLTKAIEENPSDREVNFALGVLLASGKGTMQNTDQAFECLYKFYTGDGIDANHPYDEDELDYLAIIYCGIHTDWENPGCFAVCDSGIYFTSQFQSSKKREGDYIVLPSLVMDFYLEKRELNSLRSYVGFIEKFPKIFTQQSTQKQLTKIIFMLTEQEEVIDEKNKQLTSEIQQKENLQIQMQKLVEQFTHTLGNVIFPDTIYQVAERLKTNPDCRKDVLLLNEAYHSEIIIKLQAELLRQRYANTNPEKFRQLIRACRRTADSADRTKSITDILDYAASRVTARFLNQHNASLGSIRDKILSQKNVSLDALRQQFEDDILLNKTLGSVEWINQYLRPFEVVGLSPLWQKVCILAESHAEALLFGYFSEVLFNAFKYANHNAEKFLTVCFDETAIDGKTYLSCSWSNPLGNKSPNSLGTGKGLDAILEDLRQLNDTDNATNSLLVTRDDEQFKVTLFFHKDLLINDAPKPPKFPR